AAAWPKLAAIAIALLFWQCVVWTGWKPEHVLPGPVEGFETLFDNFGVLMEASPRTLPRAFIGFGLALVIGTVLGALVARSRVARSAFGSLINGLQTMPSIAWFH